MAIQIPSDIEAYPLFTTVEIDDDGFVRLTLDLHPNEFLGTNATGHLAELLAFVRRHMDNDPDAINLAGQVQAGFAGLDTSTTGRQMSPAEARALAAALRHYAEEAER